MLATYNSQLDLLLLLIAFSITELIVSELKTDISIHEDGYSLSFQCSADVTMDFTLTACTYILSKYYNKSEIKKPGTLVRSRATMETDNFY